MLFFQSWILFIRKLSSMTIFCLRNFIASQIALVHFTVKKINVTYARFNKVENFHLPSDFRLTFTANLNGASDHGNFGAGICSNEDTDCTLCFLCRTGSFTFKNIENGLWILMSQPSACGNQSMTKIVVFFLVDMNLNDSSFWFLLKSYVRSSSDADMNYKKRFLQTNWVYKTNFPAVFQRSDLWTN